MTKSSTDTGIRAGIRVLAQSPTPATIEAIAALVREPHEHRGYAAPRVARDLAYGPDARLRLDSFRVWSQGESNP